MKNTILHKRAATEPQSMPWEQRKKPKKRADSALVENLSIADLRPFMHLTLEQAAEELKVGTTVLKRIARKCGIPKWPSRQISWLNLKIEALSAEVAKASPGAQSAMQQQLAKLAETRDEVYATGKVASGFIKQWNAKHMSDGNFTEEDGTSDADDGCYSSPQTSTASTPAVVRFTPPVSMAFPSQPQALPFVKLEQPHPQMFDIAEQSFSLQPFVPMLQQQQQQPQQQQQQLQLQQQQHHQLPSKPFSQSQMAAMPMDLPDVYFDMDELDELNLILQTFAEDDFSAFAL